MTNAATISTKKMTRGIARMTKVADHAPMVITRLSGWINIGDAKAAAPAWIIPTRSRAPIGKFFSPGSAGLPPAEFLVIAIARGTDGV